MVLLSVESDNGAVLTYRLQKPQITVGSSSKNDVVVRSPGVAERHLVINRNRDMFTFVTVDRQTVVLNGERRSRGVLNPGDRLRIGAMSLVFQGSDVDGVELVEEERVDATPSAESTTSAPAEATMQLDPSGFAAVRAKVFELFLDPGTESLYRLIGILREALPSAEVGVFAPADGENPVVLASAWSSKLPRLRSAVLKDFVASPGKVAVLGADEGDTVLVPVFGESLDVVALLGARPEGALGHEGVALLGEISRLMGLRWSEIERRDNTFSGWELEARHRLETLLPGSSQAMQVLRSGMLTAAHGADPVLVCGADGVGRTEVARILATLGPVGGRPIVIFEGRDADAGVLRQELFGPSGRPTFSEDAQGLIGKVRGGVLVIRNAHRLPAVVQSELAAVIAASMREPLSTASIRWMMTCGEDPLALVQKGELESDLFVAFSKRMLRVPRLSERGEDLPLLVAALLRRSADEQHKAVRGITLDCLNALLNRSFPGEMVELVGEVNRLVTATPDGEMVRCDDLGVLASVERTPEGEVSPEAARILVSDNLKEVVPRVEQLLIDRVMRRVKGNQSKGARILGISRGALIAKLKEYGVPDYRYLRRRK